MGPGSADDVTTLTAIFSNSLSVYPALGGGGTEGILTLAPDWITATATATTPP